MKVIKGFFRLLGILVVLALIGLLILYFCYMGGKQKDFVGETGIVAEKEYHPSSGSGNTYVGEQYTYSLVFNSGESDEETLFFRVPSYIYGDYEVGDEFTVTDECVCLGSFESYGDYLRDFFDRLF